MIQISLATLIVFYVVGLIALLLVIWVVVIWNRNRREKLSRKSIALCRICGFAFRPPDDQVVFRCPQCDSLNERERLKEI